MMLRHTDVVLDCLAMDALMVSRGEWVWKEMLQVLGPEPPLYPKGAVACATLWLLSVDQHKRFVSPGGLCDREALEG